MGFDPSNRAGMKDCGEFHCVSTVDVGSEIGCPMNYEATMVVSY